MNGRHLLAAAALVIALFPAVARADVPLLSVDYTATDITATNHQ